MRLSGGEALRGVPELLVGPLCLTVVLKMVARWEVVRGAYHVAEGLPRLADELGSETTSFGNPCSRTACPKINSAVVLAEGSPDKVMKCTTLRNQLQEEVQ